MQFFCLPLKHMYVPHIANCTSLLFLPSTASSMINVFCQCRLTVIYNLQLKEKVCKKLTNKSRTTASTSRSETERLVLYEKEQVAQLG